MNHMQSSRAGAIGIMAFSLATAVFGSGCGGAQMNNVELLDQTIAYYHIHLVSGEISRAAGYVDREIMEEFLKRHDPEQNSYEWEDFSVVSVAQKVIDKGQFNHATAVVKAKVRRNDSITIETKQFREEWKMVGGKWTLVGEEVLGGPGLKFNSDVGRNVIDEVDEGDRKESDK